jgi:hypothetical protein
VLATGALVLVRDGRLPLDEHLPNAPTRCGSFFSIVPGVGNYGDHAAYHGAVARGDDGPIN